MNRSQSLTSLLLVAGLSLTGSLLAQNADTGSGSGSDRDTPPPSGSSSMTTPSSSSSSSTSGSATSGSGSGSSSSTSRDPSAPAQPSSVSPLSGAASQSGTGLLSPSQNQTGVIRSGTNTQGSVSFEQFDADSDGRVSITEYTRSALQTYGAGSGTNNGSSATARSSGSASVSGGANSGAYTEDQFRQLDSDHDGYLSRNELSAAQRSSGANR